MYQSWYNADMAGMHIESMQADAKPVMLRNSGNDLFAEFRIAVSPSFLSRNPAHT